MTDKIVVAALYKFVSLPDFRGCVNRCCKAMLDNGIKGTLLIAEKASTAPCLAAAPVLMACWPGLAWIRAWPISITKSRIAMSTVLPHQVKLKKEIVTLGVPGRRPEPEGRHLRRAQGLER